MKKERIGGTELGAKSSEEGKFKDQYRHQKGGGLQEDRVDILTWDKL